MSIEALDSAATVSAVALIDEIVDARPDATAVHAHDGTNTILRLGSSFGRSPEPEARSL